MLSFHIVIFLSCILFIYCLSKEVELLHACQLNDLQKVKVILNDNENAFLLNKQIGTFQQTPIMAATIMGSYDVVEYLLTLDVDLSIKEVNKYTLFHAAAFYGRVEIIKLFLRNNFNPNESHGDGLFPIHRAALGREPRHTETIRAILESGISKNIHTTNEDNQTPLQVSTCHEDPNYSDDDNVFCNVATKKLLIEWQDIVSNGDESIKNEL